MAIINKTGITSGGTIQAEHVTRAIDALSGGSTDTVVATGSFSGSLIGTATTASYVLNAVSSSFATTASFALNAAAAAIFPFTGSARITGSLSITGSLKISNPNSSAPFLSITPATTNSIDLTSVLVNIPASTISASNTTVVDLSTANGNKAGLMIPVSSTATTASSGSIYFDTGSSRLYVYTGTQWRYFNISG